MFGSELYNSIHGDDCFGPIIVPKLFITLAAHTYSLIFVFASPVNYVDADVDVDND